MNNNDIKNSERYCIFEKKICPYASKKGPVFECKAPSDDDMPCAKQEVNQVASKVDVDKVTAEVEIFKLEYPNYNDETISDYLAVCDDFTAAEKNLFIRKLGY